MDRRLLSEARLARMAFLATVGLSLLGGLLIIGQASLLSRVIGRLFLGDATRADVTPLFAGLVVIIALRALIQFGIQTSASEIAVRVKHDLRRRLIDHLLALGPAFTQQERSGELTLAATDGIEALDAFFRDYLPALFTALLIPLTILLVVLPIDKLTFAVLLVTAPLIPIFMALIGSAAGALAKSRYAQLGQLSAHFLDVMKGLTTLKLFNRSRAQIDIIGKISDQYRQDTMAVLRVAFLSALVLELLATISVAVVAVEIGLRLLYGRMVFQQALFLLIIAPEFYMPLRQLGAKFHAGQDGSAAAERIHAILDKSLPQSTDDAAPPDFETIRFENVSVVFEDGERPALNSFSLTVRRGEHIALVGATGSGKSTVANLLLGFVQPSDGRITLSRRNDGGSDVQCARPRAHEACALATDAPPNTAGEQLDLNAIDIEAWRQQIAWTPQRGTLFDLSAADNIRLGRADTMNEDVTDDDVIAAATAANVHHVIEQLPDGYDTMLGENGARLSGGQAQRIALARALLRDVPLYIFDEATANLDTENERIIQQNLETLMAGKTVITIAHRLHTIRYADRIVVLDGGRIAEVGAHEALIRTQGAYVALLRTQGEERYG